MKGGTLAIYEPDAGYLDELAGYISLRNGLPFEVEAFTKKEALLGYSKEHVIDMLLVSDMFMDEDIEEIDSKKILLLCDRDVAVKFMQYQAIYKYQSADNIFKTLMNAYAEIHVIEGPNNVSALAARLIGVYSPAGRVGKSAFAMALGQKLSENESTLYINMEEFSIFNDNVSGKPPEDLCDLMYFFKRNPESLDVKLQAFTRRWQKMEYIPPPVFSQDLRDIDTKEWIALIRKIASSGAYENIVIDLGTIIKDMFCMLDACDIIYMPVNKDDWPCSKKVEVFEQYMEKSGKENLLKRMIKVDMPKIESLGFDENFVENHLMGDFGGMIEKIIERDIGKENTNENN